MLKQEIKSMKGITLTSLVITIIVILILAGVSIAVLTGPNGLIEKAQLAAIDTKKAEIKENVQFKLAELNMKKIEQKEDGATLDDVLKLKESDEEITDAYEDIDSVVLIVDGYECKISKQLEVESVSEYNPRMLRKVRRDITFCSFDEEVEE